MYGSDHGGQLSREALAHKQILIGEYFSVFDADDTIFRVGQVGFAA